MIILDQSEQMQRALTIDKVLRGKGRASLSRIQSALKSAGQASSRRTVQRDMQYMKEDLSAPIDMAQVTDLDRDGVREYYYRYTNPSWKLDDIVIDKDDIWALTLAREVLRHTVGIPGADALKEIYAKLLGLAADSVRQASIAPVPIAFAGGMHSPVNPAVWNAVLQATREKKAIRVTYAGGWNRKARKQRSLEPYYIVNLSGDWYLIGSEGTANSEIRQYKLSRFKTVKDAGVRTRMNDDFNIDNYLENVFGRFIGDPRTLVNIRVQFKKRVAPLIMEQQFHPKQKRRPLANGDVIVEFPATSAGPWPFYHVISWILSWGADAKVLAPPELKSLVMDECQRIYKFNKDD